MRIRNKEWHKTIFDDAKDKLVVDPKEYKGRWHSILKCDTLHVEIGAGKGDYWIKMSQLYPKQGFVAIEKEKKVAAIALKKSLEFDLPHSKFVTEDAVNLDEWFENGEIDILHLNFSDPWPKKSHNKRRLTTREFINTYYRLLSDTGELQIKSDNRDFFEFSVVHLSQNGFNCHEISLDYRSIDHDEDVITEYEQRFIELNQPIFRSCWKKR
ncbi:MAG: tRNA (guanosine(46)-N7)-methyltransferase TrmB [Erysipelothrix sp.]|nr:tRNA (guanosine(46)-N7)-methyltransferase TrmB [Erysipelothrix sp.]